MTSGIKVLDPNSANQIAAGEVVERPVSVIKELIENSLDAQARRIEISVEGNGVPLLRIRDDGVGISSEELPLAMLRHATSKIRKIEDLQALTTLGFRGEALPSIASVSKLQITSRPPESITGMTLVLEGGVQKSLQEVGCPVGTTVTVEDLFYNTPARLKFLRSVNTEFGLISDTVGRLAMARPDVAFSLAHPRQMILQTSGDGKLLESVAAVLGRDIARRLLPVTHEQGSWSLNGYISPPDLVRSSRQAITFILNGRYIRSTILARALQEGYHTLIPAKLHPIAVLQLHLPPSEYDVNVHPTKMDVRFAQEKELAAFIASTIRAVLLRKTPVPSFGEAKFSGGNQKTEYPVSAPAGSQYRPDGIRAGATPVRGQSTNWSGRFENKRQDGISLAENLGSLFGKLSELSPEAQPASEVMPEELQSNEQPDKVRQSKELSFKGRLYDQPYKELLTKAQLDKVPQSNELTSIESLTNESPSAGAFSREPLSSEFPVNRLPLTLQPEPPNEQSPNEQSPNEQSPDELAPAKPDISSEYEPIAKRFDFWPLAQLFNTYIMATDGSTLFLIDQHAAHERINFERLWRDAQNKKTAAQNILVPIPIEVTLQEEQSILEHLWELQKIGFVLEQFGSQTYLLRAIPIQCRDFPPEQLLRQFIEEVLSANSPPTYEKLFQEWIYLMACKESIKAQKSLTLLEMEQLLAQLAQTENPYTCPHGRPTIIQISRAEIEKKFYRRG